MMLKAARLKMMEKLTSIGPAIFDGVCEDFREIAAAAEDCDIEAEFEVSKTVRMSHPGIVISLSLRTPGYIREDDQDDG